MKILIAAPEAVPYIKTGGLADVAGALCKEYRKMRHDACIILPLYRKIKENLKDLKDTGLKVKIPVGERTISGKIFSIRPSAYFMECNEFFDRDDLYGTPQGDYDDNASRFVFFSRGVLETARALNFKPDVIHCNDWQTGLLPLYLKTLYKDDAFFKKTATLLTIHNLGYQGLFPASDMAVTNLGRDIFTPEGIEFYGKINFLKAGIISADILTTVSTTYAKEILEKEYGFGLDGVLKTRKENLYGVINGIDYEEWDPSKDALIPARYDINNMSGKTVCKRELINSLFKSSGRTSVGQMPLIGMVGRLSEQKGLELFMQAIPEILSFGVRIAILGKGDERFHIGLSEMARKYKDRISVFIGFDEARARSIYAGADFFLMPSMYEPCGLGQLIALRYGCIPVARSTGGLVDTVHDFEPLTSKGTGFLFSGYTPSALLDAFKRAFCVYTDRDKLSGMIREGMQADFSWRRSAARYIELYNDAIKKRKGSE